MKFTCWALEVDEKFPVPRMRSLGIPSGPLQWSAVVYCGLKEAAGTMVDVVAEAIFWPLPLGI